MSSGSRCMSSSMGPTATLSKDEKKEQTQTSSCAGLKAESSCLTQQYCNQQCLKVLLHCSQADLSSTSVQIE